MRASSIGVEVFVDLTEDELTQLKSNTLTGKFTSRTHHSTTVRKIPFTLQQDSNQKEFLEVSKEPKEGYFGDSDKVNFSINGEFYRHLLEYNRMEERFYGSAGKLIINIRD